MAPTIGRQWRGGSEDYAALCDYCDVRYLRSQLKKQSSGRLACVGPGTNGCGAGRDEVELDKINADALRGRRRPSKHRGGRFDQTRTSVSDIFGASLMEYWDAAQGVTSSSLGVLSTWKGQKLGATFTASLTSGVGSWRASVPEFYGRPAIVIDGDPLSGAALWVALEAFFKSGARPYVATVSLNHSDAEAFSGSNGQIVVASQSANGGSIGRAVSGNIYHASYVSTAGQSDLPIPAMAVGSVRHAHLAELDATGPLVFRMGDAQSGINVDAGTAEPWMQAVLFPGLTVTLLVLADNPSPSQIAEFQQLARSYAVKRP
jgi:hypothetical protein